MIIGEYCDAFPPELDGVGTVVKNYVQELNRLGHETYYIAPTNKAYARVQDFPGLYFQSMKVPREAYHFGIPLLDVRFRGQEKAIPFDLLHAHSPFTTGMEAKRQARRRGIPLIGTFHSKYYDDFYEKTGSRFLSRAGVRMILRFYNACDEVWAVNYATAQVLKEYGFAGDVQVMPNGTDLWYPTADDRTAADKRFSLAGKPVLLFVGQQNFKKNTRHIIEALGLLAKTGVDFRMLFVGQGPDQEKMKALVTENGLQERVIFTGQIMERTLLMQVYARADLLVFPSLYDNAPMVVREAAAAGTPALLVRGSCAAEGIRDAENGFLCEDSPEAIAASIVRALPLCGEVGAHARETVPLAWSRVMTQVMERYQRQIDDKRIKE